MPISAFEVATPATPPARQADYATGRLITAGRAPLSLRCPRLQSRLMIGCVFASRLRLHYAASRLPRRRAAATPVSGYADEILRRVCREAAVAVPPAPPAGLPEGLRSYDWARPDGAVVALYHCRRRHRSAKAATPPAGCCSQGCDKYASACGAAASVRCQPPLAAPVRP